MDPLPDFGAAEITVVPVPGNAPEDVVVDAEGQIWTGVDDGRIVRISPESGETTVVGDTGGRPLGLHVARDGRLLICDSPRGLLAMDTGTGKFETLVGEVDGRQLRFCSNVTETADGTIYFTESTSAFTYADYMAAILEARGRGSLFRRDPDGTVLTLVPGLYFANGLTLTADGSALVFAELQARRLSKYWLTGPNAGTVTALAENLPGMPDNLSTGADGRDLVRVRHDGQPGCGPAGEGVAAGAQTALAAAVAVAAQAGIGRLGRRVRPRHRRSCRRHADRASRVRPSHRHGRGERQAVDGLDRRPRGRVGRPVGHGAALTRDRR